MISEGEKQPLPHNAVSEGGDILFYTVFFVCNGDLEVVPSMNTGVDLNPHPGAEDGILNPARLPFATQVRTRYIPNPLSSSLNSPASMMK